VHDQIAALLDDVPPTAAKTGALGSAAIVEVIAHLAQRFTFPLVVDPVMMSKHGAPLVDADSTHAFKTLLIAHAHLVTPNAPEAAVLCGIEVKDRASAIDAAKSIAQLGPRAVLIKGGHLTGDDAIDVLYLDGHVHELSAPRLASTHTHGTGCTYSAAITARLAIGEKILDAISEAKGWLTEAIQSAPAIGGGIGPVNHHAPVDRWSIPPPRP
jgi:hydroxymethylpyrimidine/phosphomethylpyrimidine kinase